MTTTSPHLLSQTGNPPLAARRVLSMLEKLEHGTLTVQFPDRSVKIFGNASVPHAAITLRNWNVLGAALKSGDIGLAQTYIAGDGPHHR